MQFQQARRLLNEQKQVLLQSLDSQSLTAAYLQTLQKTSFTTHLHLTSQAPLTQLTRNELLFHQSDTTAQLARQPEYHPLMQTLQEGLAEGIKGIGDKSVDFVVACMRIVLNGNRQCRDLLCQFSLRRLPPVLRKMVWDYMLPVTSSLKGVTNFPSDPYIATLAKQCPDILAQPPEKQELCILLLSIYYSKHDIVFRQTDAQVAVLAGSVYHSEEEAVGKFIQMVRLLDEVYYAKSEQPVLMLFRACEVVDPELVAWLKQWEEGELALLIRNFVRSYGLAFLPLQSSLFICDQLFLKLRKFPLQPYIYLAIALLQLDPKHKTVAAVQPFLKESIPQHYLDSCSLIFENCRVQFPRHGASEGPRGKLDLAVQGAGEGGDWREENEVSDTTGSVDMDWDSQSMWGKRRGNERGRRSSVIGGKGKFEGNPNGNSIASIASKGSRHSSLKRQSSDVSDIDRYFDQQNDSRFLDSYTQEFRAPQQKR